MESKIFQAFICYNDEYGLQFTKTVYSKSQKMLILHEINKQILNTEMSAL